MITKLVLKQNSQSSETGLTINCIEHLYNIIHDNPNLNVVNENSNYILGKIQLVGAYINQLEEIRNKYKDFTIVCNKEYIKFEDPEFEQLLLSRNIGNSEEGITIQDLANITDLIPIFFPNSNVNSTISYEYPLITKLSELKYFTGITPINWYNFGHRALGRDFYLSIPNLQKVVFPDNFIRYSVSYYSLSEYFYGLSKFFRQSSIERTEYYISKNNTYDLGILEKYYDVIFKNGIPEEIGSYELTNDIKSLPNFSSRFNIDSYIDNKLYGGSTYDPRYFKNNVLQYPEGILRIYDYLAQFVFYDIYYVFPISLLQLNLQDFASGNATAGETVTLIFKSPTPPEIVLTTKHEAGKFTYSLYSFDYIISNGYFYDLMKKNIFVKVYVPDSAYNNYNQNMPPFSYAYSENALSQFSNWSLYRMSELTEEEKTLCGITQEDIDRQPTIIQEGGEE